MKRTQSSSHVQSKTQIHGALVEVLGLGILLTGPSGIGKSECVLELVQRGHRLVADDVVRMRLICDVDSAPYLIGTSRSIDCSRC